MWNKKSKKGFTLLEVTLFMALSGLLVVGVIAGTSRSLARQRANNALESFTDYLRNLYTHVLYTQNSSGTNGRSTRAIYGKLMSFKDGNIETYSVVGDALPLKDMNKLGSITTLEALYYLNAGTYDAVEEKPYQKEEISSEKKWDATIEKDNDRIDLKEGIKFEGTIMIVRSPLSGEISTYFARKSYKSDGEDARSKETNLQKYYLPRYSVNEVERVQDASENIRKDEAGTLLKIEDINFCFNSEDKWAVGNSRRNIRIARGGRTTAAIEIIDDIAEDNKCTD